MDSGVAICLLPNHRQRPRTAFNDPLHGHDYKIWRKKTPSEQIVSRDGVRRLRCRSAPFDLSVITLSSTELRRIQDLASKIEKEDLSKAEAIRKQKALKLISDKERIKEKYEERKYLHLKNKQTTPASSAEIDLRNKIENLEETKHFDRLVVDIKCQAIREAQLQEKEKLREQQRKEELQQKKDLERNMQMALYLENEREKHRKKANDLAAKRLTQQIETVTRLREENLNKKRQEELYRSTKWKEQLEEETEKEKKQELEKRQKLKNEAHKVRIEAMKKREEEQKRDKLEHIKLLEEAIKKQEEEDEQKRIQLENKLLKEELKDLVVREKERQIEDALRRQEMAAVKERELEERAWRAKILQEAKEKKKKHEKETEERLKQLTVKQEFKLREKIKEKEEAKRLRHHSIVTEERDNRDRIKSFKSKDETKTFLKKQIALRAARMATEADREKQEKQALALQQNEEEEAFLAYKNKTINELRKTKISDELLSDLERRFQKTKQSIKKLS